MSRPVLLLAESDDITLLQAGVDYTDNDEPYVFLGHTNRVAPAGIGGECAFYNLYFTTRHYLTTVVLQVGVVLDGKVLTTTTITLDNGSDTGTVREHEVSLMQPYIVGGVERLRFAPRGTWVEVVVQAADTGVTGAVDVGGVEIEYEVVRESRAAVTG